MLGDITAADEIYIVTGRTDMRKSIVSAKYCYAAHESRLHQNDRCKRFDSMFSFDSSLSQSRSMGQAVPAVHLTF